MTFTRRRWDAWCLVLVPALAVGGGVDGRWTPLLGAIPFWLVRFRLPAEGFHATPLRALSPARKRLIVWIVITLPLLMAACVFAPRLEAWWICPIAAAPHVAVTLWLARRVDLERGVG